MQQSPPPPPPPPPPPLPHPPIAEIVPYHAEIVTYQALGHSVACSPPRTVALRTPLKQLADWGQSTDLRQKPVTLELHYNSVVSNGQCDSVDTYVLQNTLLEFAAIDSIENLVELKLEPYGFIIEVKLLPVQGAHGSTDVIRRIECALSSRVQESVKHAICIERFHSVLEDIDRVVTDSWTKCPVTGRPVGLLDCHVRQIKHRIKEIQRKAQEVKELYSDRKDKLFEFNKPGFPRHNHERCDLHACLDGSVGDSEDSLYWCTDCCKALVTQYISELELKSIRTSWDLAVSRGKDQHVEDIHLNMAATKWANQWTERQGFKKFKEASVQAPKLFRFEEDAEDQFTTLLTVDFASCWNRINDMFTSDAIAGDIEFDRLGRDGQYSDTWLEPSMLQATDFPMKFEIKRRTHVRGKLPFMEKVLKVGKLEMTTLQVTGLCIEVDTQQGNEMIGITGETTSASTSAAPLSAPASGEPYRFQITDDFSLMTWRDCVQQFIPERCREAGIEIKVIFDVEYIGWNNLIENIKKKLQCHGVPEIDYRDKVRVKNKKLGKIVHLSEAHPPEVALPLTVDVEFQKGRAMGAESQEQSKREKALYQENQRLQNTMDTVKTDSIVDLVEEIQLQAEGGLKSTKLLYLTHHQVRQLKMGDMQHLCDALQLGDPKLVIVLFSSYAHNESTTPRLWGSDPQCRLFMGSLNGHSFVDLEEVKQLERNLGAFLREAVLEIAIKANAVVIVYGRSDCLVATTFSTLCQNLASNSEGNLPFKVISLTQADFSHQLSQSSDDQYLCNKLAKLQTSQRWAQSNKRLMERPWWDRHGGFSDVPKACTHYIVVDRFDVATGRYLDNDKSFFDNFTNTFVESLVLNLPSFAIATMRGNMGYIADYLARDMPVLLLNSGRKPPMPTAIETDEDEAKFMASSLEEMKNVLLDGGCRFDLGRCFFANFTEMLRKRHEFLKFQGQDKEGNELRRIHDEIAHMQRNCIGASGARKARKSAKRGNVEEVKIAVAPESMSSSMGSMASTSSSRSSTSSQSRKSKKMLEEEHEQTHLDDDEKRQYRAWIRTMTIKSILDGWEEVDSMNRRIISEWITTMCAQKLRDLHKITQEFGNIPFTLTAEKVVTAEQKYAQKVNVWLKSLFLDICIANHANVPPEFSGRRFQWAFEEYTRGKLDQRLLRIIQGKHPQTKVTLFRIVCLQKDSTLNDITIVTTRFSEALVTMCAKLGASLKEPRDADSFKHAIKFKEYNQLERMLQSDMLFAQRLHQPITELTDAIYKMWRKSRMPRQSRQEAMYILRDAWSAVDIFEYNANCYKLLTKLTHVTFLLLGVAITTLTIVANNDYKPGTPYISKARLRVCVIFLSAASSVVAAIVAFFSPQKRWLVLRSAALSLEAQIWKYRVSFSVDFKKGVLMRERERELRRTLNGLKSNVLKAANILDTSFFSFFAILDKPDPLQKYVYKHGQYPGCTANGRGIKFYWTMILLVLNKFICCKWIARICARRNKVTQQMPFRDWFLDEEDDDVDDDLMDPSGKQSHNQDSRNVNDFIDDHHSPVTPKRYLKLRVDPMVKFYQRRMPKYYGMRIWSEALLIAGAVVITLMAAFKLHNWTAIVATFMGLVTAWSSFMSADKKLTRYTNTVEKISIYVLWWRQLAEIEKLMVRNIRILVDGCEDCFEREYDTWCSTGLSRLQVDLDNKKSADIGTDETEEGDSQTKRPKATPGPKKRAKAEKDSGMAEKP